MLVAIPSAVKVLPTGRRPLQGSISYDTPMLYALRVHRPLRDRRPDGVALARSASTSTVHDAYFVVAHFHYVMWASTIMAFLGGLHFWWPKINRPGSTSEFWAKIAADRHLRRLQT